MRAALIGGSFNPPHVGHLMAAYWVRATQPVDEVWLVPAFNHPFHKALAPFHHRVAMCELAARQVQGVAVSRVEAEVGGEGFTVETLEHLHRTRPELSLSWVMGSDLLAERAVWHRFDRIEALATLIVVHRAGFDAPEAPGPALARVSSTEIRERLAAGLDVSGWVPRAVADYARENALYRR